MIGGSKGYNQLNEDIGLGFARNELPPVWIDVQESIEDKISKAERMCRCLDCNNHI
jgi:hypothetical protein